MAKLLRKVRKARWACEADWLGKGELQADVFVDLQTSANAMSVYRIEADNDALIKRVAAALAGNSTTLSNVDYALIDSDFLEQASIKQHVIPGETPDELVNGLHVDLVELTASQIFKLAEHISQSKTVARMPTAEVKRFISQGLKEQYISHDAIKIKDKEQLFGPPTIV